MGIQAWLPRAAAQAGAEQQALTTTSGTLVETPEPAAIAEALNPAVVTPAAKAAVVPVIQPVDDTLAHNARMFWNDVQRDDWQSLQARVTRCTACDLHSTRTQTVFGVGNQQADWLIVGEAPGADEDRQGEPFVGRAGQLLNNMLLAIGLRREQVYIANILKCRPPNNRDPRPEEVMQCEHYLRRQVELLQPKIILAVGRIAAQNLLKTDTAIGRLRGKLHYYGGDSEGLKIPVVITYHPAYLLRSPKEKRKAWQDLQFAVAVSQGMEPSI